jgi:hypothetical protein
MRCYPFPNQETTELIKLLSTAFYGWLIEFTREVHDLCWDYSVPFAAWTLWTEAYNAGYAALGEPELTRPQLIPMGDQIGGHCILENCALLGGEIARFILDRNGEENSDQGER